MLGSVPLLRHRLVMPLDDIQLQMQLQNLLYNCKQPDIKLQ